MNPANFHLYCLYYVHYDGEGYLPVKESMVHDILATFSFGQEPTHKKLKETVGKFLKANYQKPEIKDRLMWYMFFHHEEYTGWGKNPDFRAIELKILENCLLPNPQPNYPDAGTFDYQKIMSELSDEEVYDFFFLLTKPMSDATMTLKKIDLNFIR